MKISYNWLKEYIDFSSFKGVDLHPDKVAGMLTGCGLEVETVEKFQSVEGGLEGLVIGEVISREKHPDADKLSVTKVNIGTDALLGIICGAPNVEAGQKVVVAPTGTTLHSIKGERFKIKKTKIRGVASEGMICSEDEIGLGTGHEGIIVLDHSAKVGSLVKDHFNIEEDTVFEIGLTPNRADAVSHIGVARDLLAVLNNAKPETRNPQPATRNPQLIKPSIVDLKVENKDLKIEVIVEDKEACPRYSGITISGVQVKGSPLWLQNRLKAIGQKPINNIVDITNFVLNETGQPLHAFDADEIRGNKVVVKKLKQGTKFITLDKIERKLSSEDLMICNAKEPMCIAGVLGGVVSGVTEKTQNIFIESAYFNPVSIRRTAKKHDLKTEASFRFERGADPNITVYALKRAALLIKEIAGGTISSEVVDIYPKPIKDFKVELSYSNCDRLIGKKIDRDIIKQILSSLEIKIEHESGQGLSLSVPPFKVDVSREADVIEEILRIYGYNNVDITGSVISSYTAATSEDDFKSDVQEIISNLLSCNGFYEIMSNSITNPEYYKNSENGVKIINPLNVELAVMRQKMLFGGLEAIAYNQNRRKMDLKFYEFGRSYHLNTELRSSNNELDKYIENQHLALFLTGRKEAESWNTSDDFIDFYYLKGVVNNILNRLGINKHNVKSRDAINIEKCKDAMIRVSEFDTTEIFEQGLYYQISEKTSKDLTLPKSSRYRKPDSSNGKIVEFGKLKESVIKRFDIKHDVFYADFNWDIVLEMMNHKGIYCRDIPKFPTVRRDLALLINQKVQFAEIEEIANQTEKKILKEVNLFDVYEGENIEKDKKSYAVSFIFQDPTRTLTDEQVDRIMEKLIKSYEKNLKAVIR
ncbi:MAG: phenylalanine--tRNA ligase subunit beta [Bacteroidota bacterium]